MAHRETDARAKLLSGSCETRWGQNESLATLWDHQMVESVVVKIPQFYRDIIVSNSGVLLVMGSFHFSL